MSELSRSLFFFDKTQAELEDSDPDDIVLYMHPPSVSRNQGLFLAGVCAALISFAGAFTAEPVRVLSLSAAKLAIMQIDVRHDDLSSSDGQKTDAGGRKQPSGSPGSPGGDGRGSSPPNRRRPPTSVLLGVGVPRSMPDASARQLLADVYDLFCFYNGSMDQLIGDVHKNDLASAGGPDEPRETAGPGILPASNTDLRREMARVGSELLPLVESCHSDPLYVFGSLSRCPVPTNRLLLAADRLLGTAVAQSPHHLGGCVLHSQGALLTQLDSRLTRWLLNRFRYLRSHRTNLQVALACMESAAAGAAEAAAWASERAATAAEAALVACTNAAWPVDGGADGLTADESARQSAARRRGAHLAKQVNSRQHKAVSKAPQPLDSSDENRLSPPFMSSSSDIDTNSDNGDGPSSPTYYSSSASATGGGGGGGPPPRLPTADPAALAAYQLAARLADQRQAEADLAAQAAGAALRPSPIADFAVVWVPVPEAELLRSHRRQFTASAAMLPLYQDNLSTSSSTTVDEVALSGFGIKNRIHNGRECVGLYSLNYADTSLVMFMDLEAAYNVGHVDQFRRICGPFLFDLENALSICAPEPGEPPVRPIPGKPAALVAAAAAALSNKNALPEPGATSKGPAPNGPSTKLPLTRSTSNRGTSSLMGPPAPPSSSSASSPFTNRVWSRSASSSPGLFSSSARAVAASTATVSPSATVIRPTTILDSADVLRRFPMAHRASAAGDGAADGDGTGGGPSLAGQGGAVGRLSALSSSTSVASDTTKPVVNGPRQPVSPSGTSVALAMAAAARPGGHAPRRHTSGSQSADDGAGGPTDAFDRTGGRSGLGGGASSGAASTTDPFLPGAVGGSGSAPSPAQRLSDACLIVRSERCDRTYCTSSLVPPFVHDAAASHALFRSDSQVDQLIVRSYYGGTFSARAPDGTELHFQQMSANAASHDRFMANVERAVSSTVSAVLPPS